MDREVINSMINNIAQGNASDAQQQFVDLISTKLSDQLNTLKQELAGSLYSEPSKE